MIFCRPRRIAAHQRPNFPARGLRGVHERATVQVRECIREISLSEKPKIEFATFIQPLTLSRRFLTARKVTAEVSQWLVSRAPVMVPSLGLLLAPAGPVGALTAVCKKQYTVVQEGG